MTSHSKSLALLLVAALATANVTPTLAKPNDNSFRQSSEGQKVAKDWVCLRIYEKYAAAEKEADKRAGTAAADPYSKAADEWWEAGVRNSCSFTA